MRASNRSVLLYILGWMSDLARETRLSPYKKQLLPADVAIAYLEKRGGYDQAIALLKAANPEKSPPTYRGSSGVGKNRDDFGKLINEVLDGMDEAQRLASVRVFDNDLEGS